MTAHWCHNRSTEIRKSLTIQCKGHKLMYPVPVALEPEKNNDNEW